MIEVFRIRVCDEDKARLCADFTYRLTDQKQRDGSRLRTKEPGWFPNATKSFSQGSRSHRTYPGHHASAGASWAWGRGMANQMINVIFQFRSPHFHLFNLLIRRKIDLLFDAINRIVQSVVFIKNISKMVIGAFKSSNDLSVLWEFTDNWVMKVHGRSGVTLDVVGEKYAK